MSIGLARNGQPVSPVMSAPQELRDTHITQAVTILRQLKCRPRVGEDAIVFDFRSPTWGRISAEFYINDFLLELCIPLERHTIRQKKLAALNKGKSFGTNVVQQVTFELSARGSFLYIKVNRPNPRLKNFSKEFQAFLDRFYKSVEKAYGLLVEIKR